MGSRGQRERAAELLRAVADGRAVDREGALDLAREWLAGMPGGAAALAVIDGDGAAIVARVVELCGVVLAASSAADDSNEASGGAS